MAYRGVFYQVGIPPVKDDNATKDPSFGPVPDAIGYALRVLIVVAIPGVAKESSGEGTGVVPLLCLRGLPCAEGVGLMPARVLGIEPGGDTMDGSSYKLDKPCREARGSWQSRLEVTERLGASDTISKGASTSREAASYL
jgi:hypothetical protein